MRHILIVTLVLGLHSALAIADTPQEFLLGVVKSDFEGDPAARANRVAFFDKAKQSAYKKTLEMHGELPEIYYLDNDPLVVVKSWQTIAEHTYNANKTCVDIRFDLVARTAGKGLPSWESNHSRQIMVLADTAPEVVIYCTAKIDGIWKLLDPPIPRVHIAVLIDVLKKELKSAEKRVIRVDTNDPLAVKNVKLVRDSYASQLVALEAIAN